MPTHHVSANDGSLAPTFIVSFSSADDCGLVALPSELASHPRVVIRDKRGSLIHKGPFYSFFDHIATTYEALASHTLFLHLHDTSYHRMTPVTTVLRQCLALVRRHAAHGGRHGRLEYLNVGDAVVSTWSACEPLLKAHAQRQLQREAKLRLHEADGAGSKSCRLPPHDDLDERLALEAERRLLAQCQWGFPCPGSKRAPSAPLARPSLPLTDPSSFVPILALIPSLPICHVRSSSAGAGARRMATSREGSAWPALACLGAFLMESAILRR